VSYVGIDIGSRSLRVAVVNQGAPRAVDLAPGATELPLAVEIAVNGADVPRVGSCSIASLQGMVDFDRAFPSGEGERPSIDVLADQLARCRKRCESVLSGAIHGCVACVPAGASERQCAAFRQALFAAGFPRVRLIDGLLAETLGARHSLPVGQHALVCDWGDTRFAAGVFHIEDESVRPLSQEASRDVAGDTLDSAIASAGLEAIRSAGGDGLSLDDPAFLRRLASQAEQARSCLVAGEKHRWRWNEVFGQPRPRCLRRLPSPSMEACQRMLEEMIAEAMRLAEVVVGQGARPQAVLLAGSASRVGLLRTRLAQLFEATLVEGEQEGKARAAAEYASRLPEDGWKEPSSPVTRAGAAVSPKVEQAREKDQAGKGGGDATEQRAGTAVEKEADRTDNRWANDFIPYFDRAQAAFNRDQLMEAAQDLEKLRAELRKFSANLYGTIATRLDALRRPGQSLNVMRLAHQTDPSNKYLARNLARRVFAMAMDAHKRRRRPEALVLIDESIAVLSAMREMEGDFPALLAEALHAKAVILCDVGRLRDAEELVLESLRLDSSVDLYRESLDSIRRALRRRPRRVAPPKKTGQVGRNDPCPCGSGRKYKKCCGARRSM